jgi:hypothetical protein
MTELIRLMWGGHETEALAIEAMRRSAKVDIALPANVHHALFSRLHPGADAAEPETVEVAGGTELIATLAGLSGLDEPLKRGGYRVQLRSPGPVLSLIPPQMA